MSYLIIQVSDRRHTPHGPASPFVVGPFATEEEAESFVAEHGMGHSHDEYGGCRSALVVWNDVTVRPPAEAAAALVEAS